MHVRAQRPRGGRRGVGVRGVERTFLGTECFAGGCYLVDAASDERARELAALIPDTKIKGLGVEVRKFIFSDGI